MNSVVVDVKVQPDVKLFDDSINFTGSVLSGKFTMPDTTMKNRYTFIRIVYCDKVNDDIKSMVQDGNYVRVYAHLDSEIYKAKSGKTVYNKILRAERICKVQFNKELGDFEEVE